jgi:hypothetical protein
MPSVRTLLLGLLATLSGSACVSTADWQPLPRPWTAEVVDVQRRVAVLLADGSRHELEQPRLAEPAAIGWSGAGPTERFPAREIPLAQVTSIEAISSSASMTSGQRVGDVVLVSIGVVLWVALLVGIFA